MRILLMTVAAAALAACGQQAPASAPAPHGPAVVAPALGAPPTKEEAIARGKYLVENVAMCGDCHTPRTATGDADAKKMLAGGLLSVEPVQAFLPFKNMSPALAGLPQGCTEETLALFLQNGSACDNTPPLPPMPAYRMNEADAKAVAAFLASLPKPTP